MNSMAENITANYMCYTTAKELWDSLNQMYSDLGNQSSIYELTLKLDEIKQGGESVTTYFHSLRDCGRSWIISKLLSSTARRIATIIQRWWKIQEFLNS